LYIDDIKPRLRMQAVGKDLVAPPAAIQIGRVGN